MASRNSEQVETFRTNTLRSEARMWKLFKRERCLTVRKIPSLRQAGISGAKVSVHETFRRAWTDSEKREMSLFSFEGLPTIHFVMVSVEASAFLGFSVAVVFVCLLFLLYFNRKCTNTKNCNDEVFTISGPTAHMAPSNPMICFRRKLLSSPGRPYGNVCPSSIGVDARFARRLIILAGRGMRWCSALGGPEGQSLKKEVNSILILARRSAIPPHTGSSQSENSDENGDVA
ncbi:unnamed protein product [Bemisia tabaci]|uniref:Uncharacterized protein n=1 Tax=Bemisia tabaci TaxID=7038 RepID=A0A9P0ANN9_BEMTA|nr:unnamed protein product [Bemisia tabaci]